MASVSDDLTFNLLKIILLCYRSLNFYCCLRGRCCIKLCCCNKSFTAHLGAQPPKLRAHFHCVSSRITKAVLACSLSKSGAAATRRFMIASRRLPLGLLNCNWAARNFHLSPVSSGLHYARARARDCRKPLSLECARLFSACRMRLLVAAWQAFLCKIRLHTALTSAHNGSLILLFRLTSSILSLRRRYQHVLIRTFETWMPLRISLAHIYIAALFPKFTRPVPRNACILSWKGWLWKPMISLNLNQYVTFASEIYVGANQSAIRYK